MTKEQNVKMKRSLDPLINDLHQTSGTRNPSVDEHGTDIAPDDVSGLISGWGSLNVFKRFNRFCNGDFLECTSRTSGCVGET
jgi:hypothetical protein